MTVTETTEALAATLYAIYIEALGFNPMEMSFNSEQPKVREAFIQVAQFVEARQAEAEVPDHR